MDKEKLIHRHELVTSSVYKELRKEALEYIVSLSSSPMDEKILKGMLLLVNFFEKWEDQYEQALAKRKDS